MGDIRQQITDEIIKAMDAPGGAPPWRKSWATGGPAWNGSSGNHYHGINQLLLSIQPYADPRWWTFRQADYSGCKVRKGAKGVRIVKMVEVSRKNADHVHAEGAEVLAVDDQKALVMKSYVVFNGTQIEGVHVEAAGRLQVPSLNQVSGPLKIKWTTAKRPKGIDLSGFFGSGVASRPLRQENQGVSSHGLTPFVFRYSSPGIRLAPTAAARTTARRSEVLRIIAHGRHSPTDHSPSDAIRL